MQRAAIPMTADDKMKLVSKKFRVTGITTGLIIRPDLRNLHHPGAGGGVL